MTVNPEELADWTEDAIREDVDDLVGPILFAACRACDWADLAGRVEEALEL